MEKCNPYCSSIKSWKIINCEAQFIQVHEYKYVMEGVGNQAQQY